MEHFFLYKSEKANKKFVIIDEDGYKIYFGAQGYSDYTIHKDDDRRERYIKRHQKHEDWDDLSKAGTWALYLLWNKKTLAASIKETELYFGIKIVNRTRARK